MVVNKIPTKEPFFDLGDVEPGPAVSQAKGVDIAPGDWVTPNDGNGVSMVLILSAALLPRPQILLD